MTRTIRVYKLFIGAILLSFLVQLLEFERIEHDAQALQLQCPEIPSKHHEINRFRRELALNNPGCSEFLFPYFMRKTLARMHNNIFHLHIPKTGGTSLCELARQQRGWNVPHTTNCWLPSLCPFWCNCERCREKVAYAPCSALEKYHFVGNERHLDYHNESVAFCDDMNFVITMREPQAHLSSFIREYDYLRTKFPHYFKHPEHKAIIHSEYFMWALLAGQSNDWMHYTPVPEDLKRAQEVLMGFDFILDVNVANCLPSAMHLMGWSGGLPHGRQAPEGSKRNITSSKWNEVRPLDTVLYGFAKKLMEIDCAYFEKIMKHIES